MVYEKYSLKEGAGEMDETIEKTLRRWGTEVYRVKTRRYIEVHRFRSGDWNYSSMPLNMFSSQYSIKKNTRRIQFQTFIYIFFFFLKPTKLHEIRAILFWLIVSFIMYYTYKKNIN